MAAAALPFEIAPIQPPLRASDDGSVRVGGTRLLLEVVVVAYRQGYSAEEIAANFGPTPLSVIYGALDFYLQHQEQVDAYVARREREAEEMRKEWEARYPQDGLRERLLQRLAERAEAGASGAGADEDWAAGVTWLPLR